ncbi:MAG: MBL fold metallo-hydrolase [Ruminococcaceae bacterium]|nr:MBL fold metallo-hydrolase [Oscillospiraceae bacterium]
MEIKFFPISDCGANCYLVKTSCSALVIDPFEADSRVVDFLNGNKDLKRFILLTHCHFDHILGANKLRKLTGAKIAIGEKDAKGLSDPGISLSGFVGLSQEPFSADILLSDNEVLSLGDTDIKVLHTPGHTAGSVCYVLEDVIFSGDTLFNRSVGRTDFPTGDFTALKKSLNRLKSLSKDYVIYSGHGEPTTLFSEIQSNPYMK